MSTLREDGRKDWNSGSCMEQIKVGTMQRIADACELMAKNHGNLIEERDRYKRWYEDERQRREHRDNEIRGLRGRITFLLRR